MNPSTIEKFRRAGDKESVDVLEIIHADEVTHVTAGHRWFTWLCARQGGGEPTGVARGGEEEEGEGGGEELKGGVDPVLAFREEVKLHFDGGLKGPFNEIDRKKAGLTKDFYEGIDGEDDSPSAAAPETKESAKELEKGLSKLSVEYT